MEIVIAICAVAAGIVIGFFAGFVYRKRVAEKAIGSAAVSYTHLIPVNDRIFLYMRVFGNNTLCIFQFEQSKSL